MQKNNQMLNDIHCGDTRRIAAFGFSDHHFFSFLNIATFLEESGKFDDFDFKRKNHFFRAGDG